MQGPCHIHAERSLPNFKLTNKSLHQTFLQANELLIPFFPSDDEY